MFEGSGCTHAMLGPRRMTTDENAGERPILGRGGKCGVDSPSIVVFSDVLASQQCRDSARRVSIDQADIATRSIKREAP